MVCTAEAHVEESPNRGNSCLQEIQLQQGKKTHIF